MEMANDLVPAEKIPSMFVAHTEDLIRTMLDEIRPIHLVDRDISEIMNQLSDVMTGNKREFEQELRSIPKYDLIVSKSVFDSVEKQHVFKAAVHQLGWRLYDRLNEVKAFNSFQHEGEFPFIFYGLIGFDTHYAYFGI